MRAIELDDSCAERAASSEGVYVYCFARREVAGRIEATGIDDHAGVSFLTVGEVAAVFSEVSLEAFTGPSGDANLHDVSWIVPRARQHEGVVEEVMRISPVLPARFGTVFSSTSTLERLVARDQEKIRQFLERMRNREEWSIKASLDAPKAEAWMAASQTVLDEAAEQGPVSPGMRYIQGRGRCLRARQQLGNWMRQTAEEIERSLAISAVDLRRLRPHPKATSGIGGTMILNCALLVSSDRVAEVHECAGKIEARYANQGLSMSVSGPWPPYNFCSSILDDEERE